MGRSFDANDAIHYVGSGYCGTDLPVAGTFTDSLHVYSAKVCWGYYNSFSKGNQTYTQQE